MTVVSLKTKTSPEQAPPQRGLRQYYRRHAFNINVTALVGVFLVIAGWHWVVVTVPAGFVAVKYHRFAGGTDVQTIYGEGSHVKLPWDKTATYPLRLQQGSRSFEVLTRDGLMATVNIAYRFHLNIPSVGWLHRNIGPEYVETLIAPAVGSYARLIISRNSTDELFSERRAQIQDEIKRVVAADLVQRTQQREVPGTSAVLLEDVLILGIRFPPAVQAAVDRKMEQYQLREEYSYRIQREELESKRKEIEARGIAQFQNIVGAGISDNYLRWKSIDATLALAQSSNSKVVVIGNGKENTPFFIGGEDGRSPTPAPAEPNPAQVRAQTPLSGPVPTTAPTETKPVSEIKHPSWAKWVTSGVGSMFTIPPPSPLPEPPLDWADPVPPTTEARQP
jgi:regulator of protease activity HflC (stomatin/prohibitin superfamily)